MKSKAENWIRSRSTDSHSLVREEIVFNYVWKLNRIIRRWSLQDSGKLLEEANDVLEDFDHVVKDTKKYLVPVIQRRHYPDDYKYAFTSLEPSLLTDEIEKVMKEHHESLFKE